MRAVAYAQRDTDSQGMARVDETAAVAIDDVGIADTASFLTSRDEIFSLARCASRISEMTSAEFWADGEHALLGHKDNLHA